MRAFGGRRHGPGLIHRGLEGTGRGGADAIEGGRDVEVPQDHAGLQAAGLPGAVRGGLAHALHTDAPQASFVHVQRQPAFRVVPVRADAGGDVAVAAVAALEQGGHGGRLAPQLVPRPQPDDVQQRLAIVGGGAAEVDRPDQPGRLSRATASGEAEQQQQTRKEGGPQAR
jgi:hypothetical protein